MIVHPKTIGWEGRLNDFVKARTRVPLIWGENDCAMFAAGAYLAQTEVDIAAEIRGHYASFEEALKLLQNLGFRDPVEWTAARLPEIPVAFAQRGDLVGVDLGGGMPAIAVVGGQMITAPMATARGSLPLTAASRAFAVGREA
jgi:hypothetical protein